MKPKFRDMTNIEIASYICQELANIDIKTTLSGGFCVEIYSFGEYTSMDIDLVDQSVFKHKEIVKKMKELGYVQEGKHFKHDESDYTVEFPASPLAIGEELIKDISEIETEYGVLRIITPTDCVKDRLAGYYHWNDERSLEQAVLVSLRQKIDMNNIKNWSIKELSFDKFNHFKTILDNRLKTVS